MSRQATEHVRVLFSKDLNEVLALAGRPSTTVRKGGRSQGGLGSESPPVFVVRYRYGSLVLGPQAGVDDRSGLMTPCDGLEVRCAACEQLAAECSGDPPVVIVRKNCLEIYREYLATTVQGWSNGVPRSVPLNLLGQGECIGVRDLLRDLSGSARNSFVPSSRVCAGARSIFFTVPLGNVQLGKKIVKLLRAGPASSHLPTDALEDAEVFSQFISRNPWLLVRALAELSYDGDSEQAWEAEVIVLPRRWLQQRLAGGHAFLGDLCRMARRDVTDSDGRIEEGILGGLLQGLSLDSYTERTFQHLWMLARGRRPGFAPCGRNQAAGPFTRVQAFIRDRLATAPGLDERFPAILEPRCILPSEANTRFVYYSLALPTLWGPVNLAASQINVVDDLRRAFRHLKQYAPRWLDGFKVQFFTSGPTTSSYVSRLQESPEIQSDLSEQFRAAQAEWGLRSFDSFIGPVRQNFLSAFVRIETPDANKPSLQEKSRTIQAGA